MNSTINTNPTKALLESVAKLYENGEYMEANNTMTLAVEAHGRPGDTRQAGPEWSAYFNFLQKFKSQIQTGVISNTERLSQHAAKLLRTYISTDRGLA